MIMEIFIYQLEMTDSNEKELHINKIPSHHKQKIKASGSRLNGLDAGYWILPQII